MEKTIEELKAELAEANLLCERRAEEILQYQSEFAAKTQELLIRTDNYRYQRERAEQAEQRLAEMEIYINKALNELGVPNKDYPAPVANAVQYLKNAIAEEKK